MIRDVATRVGGELRAAYVLNHAGLLPLTDPPALLAAVTAARRYGQLGAPTVLSARRFGNRTAIVDERGELTYAELDDRVNRLCNAWRARGLVPGDGVAILARNHRGLLEASFAAFKAGARVILMNTDFAGPQMREVAAREGTRLLVYDDEYAAILEGHPPPPLGAFRAWADVPGDDTLEALIAAGDPAPPPSPDREGTLVLLTSGTTGTPKGAARQAPRSLIQMGGLIGKIPLRSERTTLLCTPLFHALGFANGLLSVGLGSTLVLRRRFDPEWALREIAERRIDTAILVPTMLRRMLDVDEAGPRTDTSSLRVAFVAGSVLGGHLATRAQQRLGPIVYNLYGSTEVSATTIATPDELAAAPDCVGTPPRGVRMALYDDRDRRIAEPHRTGRIFAGTGFEFDGYTGGGSKAVLDGLMATGDVGHVDEAGRLFIDGRDDDMIVSGGENVFPGEIEELLGAHPDIADAAVIGVPDEQYGQRLRAYVVAGGDGLDEEAVRQYVRDNLARFKVPREVVFVDQLPRNPTGKVVKRELPGVA